MASETTKGKGGWFPSIIGPNEKGVHHWPGDLEIEPTPVYDKKSMPYFRKNPASSADEGD